MPAGKLRVKLDVMQNTPIRDRAGQAVENWTPLRAGVMFEVTPVGGGESQRGPQVEAMTTHVLRCRWFEGAKPGLQLKQAGRVFHVERVWNEDERRRWLGWTAREVV